ncbi:hypothetical protein PWT90_08653 [Aphanocladium album]|nr:hypothetical protein PWT90_08653 [Aphanocladium album]
MKFLNITTVVAMVGLAQAAPSIAPREGCDQGICPAIHAGYDFIELRSNVGNEIRINARGVCQHHYIFTGDGCAVFSFNGGFEEKVCIDRQNSRATRTGTKGFKFHQCWHLSRSTYCDGKALWTPTKQVGCTWALAEAADDEASADDAGVEEGQ